jgi:site-specific DNA-methyltransferase (adenine-specific)
MELDVIFNEDCIQGMNKLPDRCVDMVLCDLPYGTTRNKWDCIIPFAELWAHYRRIVKENGAVVLFADGIFTAQLIQSNMAMWKYNLVWDKQRGCDFLNANVKPMKSHEDIVVFYEKKPVYNKQFWFSTPYKRQKNGALSDNYGDRKEAFSESEDGKRNPLTILSFPKDSKRLHPTQKPIALLEYLIKTYTNEGDVVLDNCFGSGSTLVAAVNTNRHYIGYELDTAYFDIACSRLDEIEGGCMMNG